MPYARTAYAPYYPPVAPLTDELTATVKATAREILTAPSLFKLLASKQRKTLGYLPKGVTHPSEDMLQA